MQIKILWELPTYYEGNKNLVSWDGQIYVKCGFCSSECCYDQTFLKSSGRDMPCASCTKSGFGEVAIHSVILDLKCQDCDVQQQYRGNEFGIIRCQHCMSQNTIELSRKFYPPFPDVVFNFMPKGKLGENYSSDIERIVGELNTNTKLPDGLQFMLIYVRLVRRLVLTSYRNNKDAICSLLNLEGNLLRDYFRRTFVLEAGLDSISCFEKCASMLTDSWAKAPVEHNIAMAAYSLLAKYPDTLIDLFTAKKSTRQLGIEAAKRALAGYVQNGGPHLERDIGRVNHLLGDLLSADTSTEADLRKAISHYDTALKYFHHEDRFAINLRVSRANTIWKLSEPSVLEQNTAISDLQASLQQTDARLWPEQHTPRFMLGVYSADKGDTTEAIKQLELAAALAMSDVNNAFEEGQLHARVREHLPILSCLAWIYGKANRAEDALKAAEALRAATISIYTMSKSQKQTRYEEAAAAALHHMLGTYNPPELNLPPVMNRLKLLRAVSPRSAFVTSNIYRGIVTTIVDTPGRFWRNLKIIEHTISGDREAFLKLLSDYRFSWNEPSVFREKRLSFFVRQMNAHLFAHLRNELAKLDVRDVIFTAPGALYGLPLDVDNVVNSAGALSAADFRVQFVPSLSVAADIAAMPKVPTGKLLIVGYRDDDLPNVKLEIAEISKAWGNSATVIEGSNLNKRDVIAELKGDYGFIHFACHATFDEAEPGKSALHLSMQQNNDAMRVTAEDLRIVKLKSAPVVTLSACSSGVASIDTGNDLFGLSGGLFRSGARAVIGSRWPVYDSFAREFMASFYGELARDPSDPARIFHEVKRQRSLTDRLENWCAFSYLGL